MTMLDRVKLLFLAVCVSVMPTLSVNAGELPPVAVMGVPSMQLLLLCDEKEQVVRIASQPTMALYRAEIHKVNQEAGKNACGMVRSVIVVTDKYEPLSVNFEGTDFNLTVVGVTVMIRQGASVMHLPQYSFVVIPVVSQDEYEQMKKEASWVPT